MRNVKIGWSEIDITPEKRASLIGQFAERISDYVEKPITATALAIEADYDQMVMVSVDVNGISYNVVEAVRAELSGNSYGLDPMKTIYAAIHIQRLHFQGLTQRLNWECLCRIVHCLKESCRQIKSMLNDISKKKTKT